MMHLLYQSEIYCTIEIFQANNARIFIRLFMSISNAVNKFFFPNKGKNIIVYFKTELISGETTSYRNREDAICDNV